MIRNPIHRTFSKRGFTLIEVMVTIAMIAIITAVGWPKVMSYISNSKLRGAILQVNSDLQRLRFMAIKENKPFRVNFYDGCYIIYESPYDSGKDCNNFDPNNDKKIKFPDGITLKGTTLDDKSTAFTGKGMPEDASKDVGEITIQNSSGDEKTIDINRLGIISIR